MIGNSNDETNFLHKLLLNNTPVSRLHKAFVNNSSANIGSAKFQLSKMVKLGGFLGRLLRSLLKPGLPLMNNVLRPLAITVLIPLGLTVAASVADAAIQKTTFRSGMNTQIVSNEEMDDIIKIVKSLEKSSLLIKSVGETINTLSVKE